MSDLKVGDDVEVLDEGLAMLRRLAPHLPPNNHGKVQSIEGETVMVEFPSGSHSQCAPYHWSEVRRRS